MKPCNKCKTPNEPTARFCFQCGTKLSVVTTGFQVPAPSKRSTQSWISAVDPVEFITHPLQRSEDVITSQNQGKYIAPELEARLGLVKNSQDSAVVEKKSEKSVSLEIQPIQVKSPPVRRANLTNLKASVPTPKAGGQRRTPSQPVHNPGPRQAPKNAPVKNQKVSDSVPSKRTPLLDSTDRLLLLEKMPSRTVQGVKPKDGSFSMQDVKRIQEKKEEHKKSRERKIRVQEDLAYLDKILPVDEEVAFQPPRGEVVINHEPLMKTNVTQSVESPEEVKVKPPKPESIGIRMSQDFAMEQGGEAVLDPTRVLQSHSWLQMVRGARQRMPSEQLKGYEHGDSSEFITPFLILAAFAYFCYVLYV